MTRLSPDAGPCGSMFAAPASGYAAYQSDVHSDTLPCMSAKPHGFSGNVPTGAGDLPLTFACAGDNVSPVENGPVVPARHAYSHSASVGKRKCSRGPSRPRSPDRSFNLAMNRSTSSNDTLSTGHRGPHSAKWLGDVPITLRQAACVIS